MATKRKRMRLSKTARYELLREHGFRCAYCGASAKTTELVIDHVVPLARGGADEVHNLAPACTDCNAGKSDHPGTSREDDFATWVRHELFLLATEELSDLTEDRLAELLTQHTPREVHAAIEACIDRGDADEARLVAELKVRFEW